MMLEQFYIACLSHASYLIGDQPAAGQSLSTHAGTSATTWPPPSGTAW